MRKTLDGLVNKPVAAVAQLVERIIGNDEAMGSSPIGSFLRQTLHSVT